MAPNYHRLTESEKKVALLLLQNESVEGIAQTLSLTEKTIRHYLNRVYKKLQVTTRRELIDVSTGKTKVSCTGPTILPPGRT